jgi:hypothetical protein
MRTEGLNLNSAFVPQKRQATESTIFMVSICASASRRHARRGMSIAEGILASRQRRLLAEAEGARA